MDENVLGSSQESLIYSQETFDFLWDQLNSQDQEVKGQDPNLSSCARDVKIEMLDSSDFQPTFVIPNHANEDVSDPNVEMYAADQVNVSSVQPSNPSPGASTLRIPSSLPACTTWPGDFDFTVSFGTQEKKTKSISWTYSKIKDKLYVSKDTPCPILFSTSSPMPQGVNIRVMVLYTSPKQVTEVVKRCVNHSMDEINRGVPEAEHLVRCECPSATYVEDPATGRHSVLVPFDNPPVWQQHSIYIFKFACFGSCAGGPNRRPLMLIFTLEKGDEVIGRKKLDVKICACPGRDRKTEEAQHLENESNSPRQGLKRKESSSLVNLSDVFQFTKSAYIPSAKKSKILPDKDGYYSLQVKDPKCYEFLIQMKKFYELCKLTEHLSPDLKAKAFLACHKPKNGDKSD